VKLQGGPIHALLTYLHQALRADRHLIQFAESLDLICKGTYAAAPIQEKDGKLEVYATQIPCLCYSATTAGAYSLGVYDGLQIKGSLWYVHRTPKGQMEPDGRPAEGSALALAWSLSVLWRLQAHLASGALRPVPGAEPTWTLADGRIDKLEITGDASLMVEGSDLCGFKLPLTVNLAEMPFLAQDPPACNIVTATMTPYSDGTLGTGGTATVIGPDVILSEVTDGP
jgi:hypothetical protein